MRRLWFLVAFLPLPALAGPPGLPTPAQIQSATDTITIRDYMMALIGEQSRRITELRTLLDTHNATDIRRDEDVQRRIAALQDRMAIIDTQAQRISINTGLIADLTSRVTTIESTATATNATWSWILTVIGVIFGVGGTILFRLFPTDGKRIAGK